MPRRQYASTTLQSSGRTVNFEARGARAGGTAKCTLGRSCVDNRVLLPSAPPQGSLWRNYVTTGTDATFEVVTWPASSSPNDSGLNTPPAVDSSLGPKAAWATTTAPAASRERRITPSVPLGETPKVQKIATGLAPRRGSCSSHVRIDLAGPTPATTNPSTQVPTTKKSTDASSRAPTFATGSALATSP